MTMRRLPRSRRGAAVESAGRGGGGSRTPEINSPRWNPRMQTQARFLPSIRFGVAANGSLSGGGGDVVADEQGGLVAADVLDHDLAACATIRLINLRLPFDFPCKNYLCCPQHLISEEQVIPTETRVASATLASPLAHG